MDGQNQNAPSANPSVPSNPPDVPIQPAESMGQHTVAIFAETNNNTPPPQFAAVPTAESPAHQLTPLLAGSQMPEVKKKLPVGVYIIVTFSAIGFGVSFFDTSQNSLIYTGVMFADLLLSIGLLMRLEAARKIIFYLMGITLILSVVGLFMLARLQQRIEESKTNYDTAISKIDQNRLTPVQKQQLDSIKTMIADQEKLAGKAITFTYIKLGATIVESLVLMVYLTRPKVKDVFEAMKT